MNIILFSTFLSIILQSCSASKISTKTETSPLKPSNVSRNPISSESLSGTVTLSNSSGDGFINLSEKDDTTPLFTIDVPSTVTVIYEIVDAAIDCSSVTSFNMTSIPRAVDLTVDGTYKVCVKLTSLNPSVDPVVLSSPSIVRDTVAPIITGVSSQFQIGDNAISPGEEGGTDPLVMVAVTGQIQIYYLAMQGDPTLLCDSPLYIPGLPITSITVPHAADIGLNALDHFICSKAVDEAGNATYKSSAVFSRSGNQAPVLDAIPNETVAENTAITGVDAGDGGNDFDADNQAINYTCYFDTTSDSAVNNTNLCTTLSGVSFTVGTGVMSWTPSYTQSGTYEFKITGSDGSLSDDEFFVITVTNTNRAPLLDAISDQTVAENTAITGINAGDGGDDFDADSQAINYTCYYDTSSNGTVANTNLCTTLSGVSFTVGTGAMSWTPSYTQSGSYEFKITGSDGSLSDDEFFVITVSNTNRAPVLDAISDQTVAENTAITGINAGDGGDDFDADNQAISYTCYYDTSSNGTVANTNLCTTLSGVSFTVGTGVMSWTPSTGQAGIYEFKVTGSDGSLTDDEFFVITVTASGGGGFAILPKGCTGPPNNLKIASDPDAYGAGTTGDPYRLCSPDQIINLHSFCANIVECAAVKFLQMNDINMNGKSYAPFQLGSGEYDGNNFKISNLSVNTASANSQSTSFIDLLNAAVLKNLTFDNLDLSNTSTLYPNAAVVNITGTGGGATISNVHVISVGGASTFEAKGNIGGILAMPGGSDDTIIDCSVDVSLTSTGTSSIIGGIAANMYGSQIKRSFAKGTISNLTNTGITGGIIGLDEGTDLDKVASGMMITVNDHVSHQLGGLIGRIQFIVTVSDSLSFSSMPGLSSAIKGGIVGYMADGSGANEFHSSPTVYWDADLANTSSELGGIANFSDLDDHGGQALSTVNMKKKALTSNLSYKSTWYIDENNDYPRLVTLPGACLLAAAKTTPAYNSYADIGDGSIYSPYIICTPEQLNNIGAAGCGTGITTKCGKNFALGADLDMSLDASMDTMISGISGGEEFSGIFDGRRHIIDHFTNDPLKKTYVGLFRKFYPAATGISLRNLGLTNLALSGSKFVGGVVGEWAPAIGSNLQIIGIYSSGNITGTASANGDGLVGGLLGQFGSISGTVYVYNSFSLTNISWNNVTYSTYKVGGIVGGAGYIKLADSYFSGSITLSGTGSITEVGGVAGSFGYAGLYQSFSKGSIFGSAGVSAHKVSGLIGDAGFSNTNDSYSTMSITLDTSSDTISGLVGSSASTDVTHSYAATPIKDLTLAVHPYSAAVFSNIGSAHKVIWDIDIMNAVLNDGYNNGAPTSPDRGVNVFAAITTDMKDESQKATIYPSWDFTNTWNFVDGNYPKLLWEP